ncbi:MAG: ABC transporter ATP-binding protein [Verrucomicrobiae bacterium]|nr:ABC transporter ATP-binding protein [Verrucomicrobiae bacterium]
MVSIRHLHKTFGARVAVDDLSLEIPRGEIFGLLGHNGAGKSTTIGMLLGQIFPDHGEAMIGGIDVFRNRQHALSRVGAIFETPVFYDYLSGWNNLRIFCEYTAPFDPVRGREIVRLVGLENRIGERVGNYSHGMRQRLALAQTLLPNPELLILDEPTDGLDPEGIHEVRNLILRLNREQGLTIIFSSHLLGEVQQLCSHLAVIREGSLLFAGQWQPFVNQERWIFLQTDRQSEAEAALLSAGLLQRCHPDGHALMAPDRNIPDIAEWLVHHRHRIQTIRPQEKTLEDFYLDLVRNESRPEGVDRLKAEN